LKNIIQSILHSPDIKPIWRATSVLVLQQALDRAQIAMSYAEKSVTV
jgi:hypothetical protein